MVIDDTAFQRVKGFTPQAWSINLDTNQFNCPQQLISTLGYPNQTILTLSQLFAAFEKAQLTQLKKHIKLALKTGESIIQTAVLNAYQHRYIAEIVIDGSTADNKEVTGTIELKQYFLTKQQELEFLKSIFNKSNEGFMIADVNHTILKVNQAMCRNTGYPEHELLGQPAAIMKSGRYTQTFYQKLWQHVDQHKIWTGELLAKTKLGEVYAHEARIQRIDLPGDTHVYVSSSHRLDTATDLWDEDDPNGSTKVHVPDKNAFTKKLNADYQQLGNEVTIICLVFNVSLAQTASSMTRQWLIAQRFSSLVSQGHLGILNARMFSAYWVVPKKMEDIETTLKQAMKALEGNNSNEDIGLSATVNGGVSVLQIDATSPIQLLSHATQALIANPQDNGSSLYYFDRRLAKRFDRKSILAALLKQALTENKIEVYYQPIVATPSLKIAKFEALFRIKLDTKVPYNVQELIEIAEEYSWIDQVDAAVTKQALNDLPILQKHYHSARLGMSINRSVVNDRVSHCCLEDTLTIFENSGIDLSLITLELTESAYFDDSYYHSEWLDKLKAHNIAIALDDFGTGYSSFSYLRQIPVNIVKIDRSFVSGLTEQSNEYSMIDMLCKLTHKMGGQVIAEGVETKEELFLLSKLNVDMLQGYIFSKPRSLQDILADGEDNIYPQLTQYVHKDDIVNAQTIMQRELPKVGPDDKLKTALEKLKKHNSKYLLVTEKSRCIGVLHQSDVNAAVSPYLNTKGEQNRDLMTLNKRVHQVMHKDHLPVDMDTSFELLLTQFISKPNTVVVVEGANGVCLGVILLEDLLVNHHRFVNREH
ncbi:EAL domain-containing protein [Agarivorans sp. Toyoura001]|uniref:EAL domain-containing protein n=1 Tax=unclassified Agarivorans TaxID=2636026 RepID=UPI0010CEFDB2|nr:EAL domain-containing protein [Agarivorans sp. Toyoura001]GDY24608.1 ggdef family protein [Agarivorans sp. Toyoura001]